MITQEFTWRGVYSTLLTDMCACLAVTYGEKFDKF